MDLSTIKNTGNWGSSAANLNENFSKVGLEVDKLKYTAYNSKLYATEALLKQAVPSPKVGDWAIVGDSIPGEIYQCRTDGVWTATGQTGGGYGMEVTEKYVNEITEVHNEYTGDIINNPDDEDLYSEEVSEGKSVLKLADKAYNASSFSGMGRAYLRKNITGGKNVLTQAMMDKANTRYVIQYDYDLNGETVTLSKNSTLVFNGGSISNGTIIGNNTKIEASIEKIFGIDVVFDGSWSVEKCFPQWFGAIGNGEHDDRPSIQSSIDFASSHTTNEIESNHPIKIIFPKVDGFYNIASLSDENNSYGLIINKGYLSFEGEGTNTIIKATIPGDILISLIGRCSNIHISNICISSNDLFKVCISTTSEPCPYLDFTNCLFTKAKDTAVILNTFVSRFNSCIFSNSNNGVKFSHTGDIPCTSLSLFSCYCVDCKYYGYYFGYVVYSSLISCACDRSKTAYYFDRVYGLSVNGCGCEGCEQPIHGHWLRACNINSFSIINFSFETDYLIKLENPINVVISGIYKINTSGYKYVLGVTSNTTNEENVTILDNSIKKYEAFYIPNYNYKEPICFVANQFQRTIPAITDNDGFNSIISKLNNSNVIGYNSVNDGLLVFDSNVINLSSGYYNLPKISNCGYNGDIVIKGIKNISKDVIFSPQEGNDYLEFIGVKNITLVGITFLAKENSFIIVNNSEITFDNCTFLIRNGEAVTSLMKLYNKSRVHFKSNCVIDGYLSEDENVNCPVICDESSSYDVEKSIYPPSGFKFKNAIVYSKDPFSDLCLAFVFGNGEWHKLGVFTA